MDLVDFKRVAFEIKNIGLYDFILQDMQKTINQPSIAEEEILHLLHAMPIFLETYKIINVENNISNIHINSVDIEINPSMLKINENLNTLRELEKYTLPFEESPTLVFIFSIEFFVLFSVQYFIVLLGLKEWQWEIYGIFGLSVVIAWIYAKRQKEKYAVNNKRFKMLFDETLQLFKKDFIHINNILYK